MAERGNEKMTEWLGINVETLSSEERFQLIEEIFTTLNPQELLTIRDLAERHRQSSLAEAKAAVLEEMKGRLSALGLSLNDVIPARRARKSKSSSRVKYRSPDGETWSGRGQATALAKKIGTART